MRTKKAYDASIKAVGGLISKSGSPNSVYMDAEMADGRRVLIGFPISDWAAEKFGRNNATARRMRTLAETLLKAAERLEQTKDDIECAKCGVTLHWSLSRKTWYTTADGQLWPQGCPAGTHIAKEGEQS